MNPRSLLYGNANRDGILKGTRKFTDAVCTTYGPKGRNVVLNRAAGLIVTKDGVTVAREVDLSDPIENMACQALKEACVKVNNEAGDGTTTAACISGSIIQEAVKQVSSGCNPIFLARGLQKACDFAVESIQEQLSAPIETQQEIESVALISSNRDEEVSRLMAEAIMSVGKNGNVTIEDGHSVETSIEFKDGLEFDRGPFNSHFLKNQFERELDTPLVAIVAGNLITVDDVLNMCEESTAYGKALVIFAYDVRGEALNTLLMNDNATDHDFEFVPIKAPGNFQHRIEYLGDIAAITGATVVDSDQGMKTSEWNQEWFGSLDRMVVRSDKCTLFAHEEASNLIDERISHIQAQYRHTTSQYDTDKLNERLAALEGGLCVMKIGAHTEAELKEKRARVEDALGACQAALESGVVPGGGTAYLAASQLLEAATPPVNEEERVGWNILRKALRQPLFQLATNAGHEGAYVVAKALSQREPTSWLGWDAYTGEMRDFASTFDIIDPAKVAVEVIRAATSAASTLITSEVSITKAVR